MVIEMKYSKTSKTNDEIINTKCQNVRRFAQPPNTKNFHSKKEKIKK